MDITEYELKALEGAKSIAKWNTECAKIKRTRSGQYPSDWWAKVSQSGLMRRVAASWGK